MSFCTRSIAILLTVGAAIPAAGQETLPLGKFIENTRKATHAQCESSKRKLEQIPAGAEKQEYSVRQEVELNCNCLPTELENAAKPNGGMQSTTLITKDQAMGVVTVAYATCAARIVRAQAMPACMRDDKFAAGVSDRAAYCACISDSLDKVEDAKVLEAATTAHRNFQKKVAARQRGEPDPEAELTVMDEVTNACKEKYGK